MKQQCIINGFNHFVACYHLPQTYPKKPSRQNKSPSPHCKSTAYRCEIQQAFGSAHARQKSKQARELVLQIAGLFWRFG
jgi:hypothetical protein